MRKLDLRDYEVTLRMPDPANPAGVMDVTYPYHVKDSVLNYMFIPALRLSGAELVKQNAVALKIEACKEDVVELEEDEFARVKMAFDTFQGFTRQDLKMVERIRDTKQED